MSRIEFSEVDLSLFVARLGTGVHCVQGITEKGNFGEATLVESFAQFVEAFGSYQSYTQFPLLCRRAFDYGAKLYVSRVDADDTPGVLATSGDILDAGTNASIVITASSPGIWGNSIEIFIENGTADDASNVTITHPDYDDEVYTEVNMTALDERNLADLINANSVIASAADQSSVSAVGSNRRLESQAATALTSGVNPDGYVDGDYSDNFSAFDNIQDSISLATPEIQTSAVNTAGIAYAEGRLDMVYYYGSPIGTTATAAIALNTYNSSYGVNIFGDLTVTDRRTSVNTVVTHKYDPFS